MLHLQARDCPIHVSMQLLLKVNLTPVPSGEVISTCILHWDASLYQNNLQLNRRLKREAQTIPCAALNMG